MTEALRSAFLFFLDLGIRASVVFAVTGLLLLAVRRSGAATRHFVATAGLAASLLLPILSLASPRFELPVLPLPRLETALTAENRAGVASWLGPTGILALWLVGCAAVAARLIVGAARVRRISRDASLMRDPDWLSERDAAARRLDLHRIVPLLESSSVPVAMTSGWRKPLLLLGHAARLWEIERRRIVLLHELAHVRRADWLALVLAESAAALYWFHPGAWWLVARLRRDAEAACDDLVISAGTKPSVYAGHLLGIFRSLESPSHPVAPALAIARPHHFEERLRAILDPRGPRVSTSLVRSALYAAGLVVAAFAVAAIEPWQRPCPLASASVSPRAAACVGARTPGVKPAAAIDSPGGGRQRRKEVAPEPSLPVRSETLPAIWKSGVSEASRVLEGFVQASHRELSHVSGSRWYDHGMELHRDENYLEAIEAFEHAIDEGYREGASSYNIACGYALLGESDQAFEWLHRAMEAGFDVGGYLGDDDLENLHSDSRWLDWKKVARQAKSRQKDYEAAGIASRYERLAAKAPASGEPYFDVGLELLRAGRYDLAAQAYQAAIDRRYRMATALYNKACALSLAGDREGALDLLRRSLDAGFDQPETLRRDDDLDNLRDDARFAALEREARDLSLPGTSWWGKGSRADKARWRDSAARFQTYVERHPDSGRAWFNLGYASLMGDRPEGAADAFQRALGLEYRTATTMYNLACAYARLDQKDAAFEWLFRALDAGFDSPGLVRSDADLDNLRDDPRYRKALQIARNRDRQEDARED